MINHDVFTYVIAVTRFRHTKFTNNRKQWFVTRFDNLFLYNRTVFIAQHNVL